MSAPALGLVVNPVAGMGGRVGLHGTDGPALALAHERGAAVVAPARTARALDVLQDRAHGLEVLVAGGVMGADHVAGRGWAVTELPLVVDGDGQTRPAHTRDAVAAMVEAGVRLVLFAGGDGTARDVAAAAGDVPVLGIPAGVKMHSGVFGTTPAAAGAAAARFLAEPTAPVRDAELVDRDADEGLRLFATARVPAVPSAVQARKGAAVRSNVDDATLLALGVVDTMVAGRLYLLGPGTTVGCVSRALGVASSPLGVDAVRDGRVVAFDASEAQLLDLLVEGIPASLVLGVVGGQGFLLGRGNQQLSARVLAATGIDNIEVVATEAKLAGLPEPVLHIDIDDPDLAARLVGYRRVRTGRTRSTVLRVVA